MAVVAGPRNLVVERGDDPARLVIAFTGNAGRLSVKPYDFYDLTGMLGQSRILLRDPSRLWYQKGVDHDAATFPQLVDLLRGYIAELAPARVTVIGSSMGGFAAILAGHLLGADDVQAFGPQVSIHPFWAFRRIDRLLIRRGAAMTSLLFTRPRQSRLFDLARVLRVHNGRTRYFVHVCEHGSDLRRARRLAARPGVEMLTYPGGGHKVVLEMVRSGYMAKLFRLEPPDTPRALHERIYGTGRI